MTRKERRKAKIRDENIRQKQARLERRNDKKKAVLMLVYKLNCVQRSSVPYIEWMIKVDEIMKSDPWEFI